MSTAPSPARGDATRDALIRAAVEIFGRDGFDATGTRALADAAGVNQALIAYHFGGKAGLYRAAIEYIVERVHAHMEPLLAGIDAELGDGRRAVSQARCLAMLRQLLDALVVVVTGEESGTWARLILKEQQDPSEGFDILYDGFMSHVIGTVTRLAGRIRRLDPDSEAANLLAFTLIGQILVFRTGRAAVERRTGWHRFSPREISAVQAQVHNNVTAILMQENSE
jgi:AcrR family transcriptional regulator